MKLDDFFFTGRIVAPVGAFARDLNNGVLFPTIRERAAEYSRERAAGRKPETYWVYENYDSSRRIMFGVTRGQSPLSDFIALA